MEYYHRWFWSIRYIRRLLFPLWCRVPDSVGTWVCETVFPSWNPKIRTLWEKFRTCQIFAWTSITSLAENFVQVSNSVDVHILRILPLRNRSKTVKSLQVETVFGDYNYFWKPLLIIPCAADDSGICKSEHWLYDLIVPHMIYFIIIFSSTAYMIIDFSNNSIWHPIIS